MTKSTLIGPLMLDVVGPELTAEDREVIAHPLVGGIILFSRNYRNRSQLHALCRAIRGATPRRILLAVDHEGGRVQRFRSGFTQLPPMRGFGARFAQDRAAALAGARDAGLTIGRELAAFDIDLPFAPVLDIDHGVSGVIGNRAFASEVDPLVALASAFRAGLRAAGLSATGKHYPGHGAVTADSHHELPLDPRSFAAIWRDELQPFARLAAEGLESVMTAHVHYPGVDRLPASLSRYWIQTLLRQRLGFRGVVFSDDLSMGGAAAFGSLEDRARLALDAGSDMALVCNDRPGSLALLDALRDIRPQPGASARLQTLYRRPV